MNSSNDYKINIHDDNTPEEVVNTNQYIYDVDNILDKIKRQFHNIDKNDVINIYIDDKIIKKLYIHE